MRFRDVHDFLQHKAFGQNPKFSHRAVAMYRYKGYTIFVTSLGLYFYLGAQRVTDAGQIQIICEEFQPHKLHLPTAKAGRLASSIKELDELTLHISAFEMYQIPRNRQELDEIRTLLTWVQEHSSDTSLLPQIWGQPPPNQIQRLRQVLQAELSTISHKLMR